MRLTIIIKVFNINLLWRALDNLRLQSISDKLEIICIKDNFDDISTLVEQYKDTFNKIMILNEDPEKVLYNSALKTSGEFIFFTDSNLLTYEYYHDKTILEKVYETASNNDSDILICNINKHQVQIENYNFLNSLTGKLLISERINEDQLISLANLDCDFVYSNKFKIYDSEEDNSNLVKNQFRLKTLIRSKKIFIIDDYSKFKTHNKNLILKDKPHLENNIKDYYKKIRDKTEGHITLLSLKDFNPYISIIIPVYNPSTKDILKAIYSITNQTFDFHHVRLYLLMIVPYF